MSVYIKSIIAVSAQDTFENNTLPQELAPATKWMKCITPEFKKYIPVKVLRRMNRFSRISSVSAFKSLANLGIEKPEAIITATSLGCADDSEKFLNQMLDNNEMLLTPTSFIQSTHNAVGSNLALAYKCHGYNMVYTHDNNAFETALLDASLKIKDGKLNNILIGAVDEISEENYYLKDTLSRWKSSEETNLDFASSITEGTIPGEGATFMTVTNDKEDAELELIGTEVFYSLKSSESLSDRIKRFVKNQNIDLVDVDTLMLAIDGDIRNVKVYQDLMGEDFKHANICHYKHICGSYDSDGGFAVWVASQMVNKVTVPDYVYLRKVECKPKIILIARQNLNRNFGLVLLRAV
ncbi:beta-ketoacyl synthase chain length factor [Plebeiibacterium sediminum]|uniref:Beta-ketoacyl synthase chain length factor n=1 Tax=Plebeiibacterium sediminum TaxID=2992112 RepID=A0AAE3SER8_9BACT|nr:beta-ketoacyl synthase chain length factor [Plebeiobacterium sediminum]MCW3786778.1 beta-ketoacyl synthase chain length factor [Plebeiobacterium sediminum]